MREMPRDDFDWVTARQKCSMVNILQTLRILAKANVAARNAQQADSVGYSEPDYGGDVIFTVWRIAGIGRNQRVAADFALSADGNVLTVKRGDQAFDVTVTLDDFGVCKCKVGGEELAPWQVLKRALEPILFREG